MDRASGELLPRVFLQWSEPVYLSTQPLVYRLPVPFDAKLSRRLFPEHRTTRHLDTFALQTYSRTHGTESEIAN